MTGMPSNYMVIGGDSAGITAAVESAQRSFRQYNASVNDVISTTTKLNKQQQAVEVTIKGMDKAGRTVSQTFKRLSDSQGNLLDKFQRTTKAINRQVEALEQLNKAKAATLNAAADKASAPLQGRVMAGLNGVDMSTVGSLQAQIDKIGQVAAKMKLPNAANLITKWADEIEAGSANFKGRVKGTIQRMLADLISQRNEAIAGVASQTSKRDAKTFADLYSKDYADTLIRNSGLTGTAQQKYAAFVAKSAQQINTLIRNEQLKHATQVDPIRFNPEQYLTDPAKSPLASIFSNVKGKYAQLITEQTNKNAAVLAKMQAEGFTKSYGNAMIAALPTDMPPGMLAKAQVRVANLSQKIGDLIAKNQFTPKEVAQAQLGITADPRLSSLSQAFAKMKSVIDDATSAKDRHIAKSLKLAQSLGYERGVLADLLFSWQAMGRLLTIQLAHTAIGKLTAEFGRGIREAAAFQTKITQMRTIAQDNQQTFGAWADTIARVSNAYGTDVLDTAKAAYDALSNQVARGAQVEGFLAEAAKFAMTTNSSLSESGNLLAAVLNSYNLAATDANRVSATLFKTIDLGRVSASEMANTFGRVAVLSKEAGVELDELGAMISLLTIKGTKYNEAYTLINNVLLKLVKPTKGMKEYLQELGYASGFAAIKAMGFTGFLQQLNSDLEKSPGLLQDVFNEMRALRGAISLTGGGLDDYTRTLAKFKNAQADYANANKMMFESPGQRLQREMERMQTYFTTEVGPTILKLFDEINSKVGGFANALKTFVPSGVALLGINMLYRGLVSVVGMLWQVASTGTMAFAALANGARGAGVATTAQLRSLATLKASLSSITAIGLQVGIAYASYKIMELMRSLSAAVDEFSEKYRTDIEKRMQQQVDASNKAKEAVERENSEKFRSGYQYFNKMNRLSVQFLAIETANSETLREQAAALLSVREKFVTAYYEKYRSQISKTETSINKLEASQDRMRAKLESKQSMFDLNAEDFDPAAVKAEIERLKQVAQEAFGGGKIDIGQDAYGQAETILDKVMSTAQKRVEDINKQIAKVKENMKLLTEVRKKGDFFGASEAQKQLQNALLQLTGDQARQEGLITAAKAQQKKLLEEAIALQDQLRVKQQAELEIAKDKEQTDRARYETFRRRVDEVNSYKVDPEDLDGSVTRITKLVKETKELNKEIIGDPKSVEQINNLLDRRLENITKEVGLQKSMKSQEQTRTQLETERERLDKELKEFQNRREGAVTTYGSTAATIKAQLEAFRRETVRQKAPINRGEYESIQDFDKRRAAVVESEVSIFTKALSAIDAVIGTDNPQQKARKALEAQQLLTAAQAKAAETLNSKITGADAEKNLEKLQEAVNAMSKAVADMQPARLDERAASHERERLTRQLDAFGVTSASTLNTTATSLLMNSYDTNRFLKDIDASLKILKDRPVDNSKPMVDSSTVGVAKGKFWGGLGGDTRLTPVANGEMVMNRQAVGRAYPMLQQMNLQSQSSRQMTGGLTVGDIHMNVTAVNPSGEQMVDQFVTALRSAQKRGRVNLNT